MEPIATGIGKRLAAPSLPSRDPSIVSRARRSSALSLGHVARSACAEFRPRPGGVRSALLTGPRVSLAPCLTPCLTLRSRCCAAAGSMVLAGKDEEEGAVWRSAITLMCEYAARPV